MDKRISTTPAWAKTVTVAFVAIVVIGIWLMGYYAGRVDAMVAKANGATFHAMPVRVPMPPHKKVHWKTGKASTYGIGDGLLGHNKANGKPLTAREMAVAHKHYPLGTVLVIKYKGRTVRAVVRDRGPYIRGRVLDLAPATARALHFRGVHKVRYRVIKWGHR